MDRYNFNSSRPAWSFKSGRFTVSLYVKRERGYRYDGDDEDGETQAMLDSGEFVAFVSHVSVTLDGEEIGCDYLGGSVYDADRVSEFWTAHRDPNPAYRNTSENRAAHKCFGHYFPDMVSSAIEEARQYIRNKREACERLPRIRESAR